MPLYFLKVSKSGVDANVAVDSWCRREQLVQVNILAGWSSAEASRVSSCRRFMDYFPGLSAGTQTHKDVQNIGGAEKVLQNSRVGMALSALHR